jgi:hypothetical protein
MNDRNVLNKRFGSKYKNLAVCDTKFQDKCFYCGENMDCYDHAPPLAMIRDVDGLYHRHYLLMPSCRSCNSLLGPAETWNLQERAELSKSKIYSKYNKNSIIGDRWSVEDLQKFDKSSSLFLDIVKVKYMSLIVIDRLLFVNPMFYIGGDKHKTYLLNDTTVKYSYLNELYTDEELEELEKLFRKYLYQ